MRRFISRLACLICLAGLISCGSPSINQIADESPAQNINTPGSIEQLIYTEGYAGYLVVFLKDSPLLCKEGQGEVENCLPHPSSPYKGEVNNFIPLAFRPILNSYPDVELKRSISTPPEVFTKRRLYLEKLSGKKLQDFNLIYHIQVEDPDQAVEILRELQANPNVEKVYPGQKTYVTGIATVPDLISKQTYLYPNETHGGLNAQAAWTRGVRGAGVMIIDGENDWNFDHEDLPLDWPDDNYGSPECYPTIHSYCLPDFAHGTAVVGILGALNNGHGTTGFASEADIKVGGGGGDGLIDIITRGAIPVGSIYAIELQRTGPLSPDGFCSGFGEADQYGCLPVEANAEDFAGFELATAAGLTIISGGGNGSVSLDNPAAYYPTDVTLYDHDSGSIIVGASEGPNHRKISFSNYGSPVDIYAWGQNVVTTAYPYGGSSGPFYWTPGAAPNPPNDDNNAYYTNRFGGTSSATAMVAGAAALIQSHAKTVMGENTRYLMPLKLREILTSTGADQSEYPRGDTYRVCPTPGGVHPEASACTGGYSCFAIEPSTSRECRTNNDCLIYRGFFTLSPQCIGGHCGMSLCTPRCSSITGGCASKNWYEMDVSGTCYCRPPFGTYAENNGNIGNQPRIDRALTAVDTFWTNISRTYPELVSGGRLTEEEIITLRAQGVGLICKEASPSESDPLCPWEDLCIPYDPVNSNPDCPDEYLFPPGEKIAKALDFDGDGRADLVSWTNGTWKVDLSTVGTTEDKFGDWDLVINYPPTVSKWVWPYVEDYNSDGREDFAVYDKEHGKWYIKFTTSDLLENGTWGNWDWVIDYSSEWVDTLEMDPWESKYSRPAPGDYNGDGWMDIAIACSDGILRIDYGGENRSDYGTFNSDFRYLHAERLSQAPGWAYPSKSGMFEGSLWHITYKVPDGLTDEGKLGIYAPQAPSEGDIAELNHFKPIFGGNQFVFFTHDEGWGFSIKDSREWIFSPNGKEFESTPPQGEDVWGSLKCRPILADFDGDNQEDRAVMCPDEWHIAYTSNKFITPLSYKTIALNYDENEWTLPGRSYAGGISYSLVQQLIAYFQETNPGEPPPIPVDMATTCLATDTEDCQ